MIYLEHIHGVEAGVKALVALIVGDRVEHGVIHPLVIISVESFPYQKEVLLQAVAKAS